MKYKFFLIFLCLLLYLCNIQAAPVYTNISFSTNITLQSCINNYSGIPTGNVTYGGVPFSLGSTPYAWNSHTAAGGGAGTVYLDIAVNKYAVTEVHTLINNWWGQANTNLASLTFYGASGATYTKSLYGNSDIRDYLNGSYTNSINGTTTTVVWTGSNYRLDKQKIVLPTSFAEDTLVKIRLTDWGNGSVQRTFLSGVTVGTLPPVLSASSTNFGNVRVGTSSTASVTATNTGASGSSLNGTIGAASGSEFSPTSGTQSFNLAQNASSSRTFTYTPSARGADSTNVSITSDGGNATRTLTGTGVSPVYSSSVAPSTTIDFGTIDKDQTISRTLTLQNTTPDADLGNLTNLTLISATISGVDASYFSLTNFTPGMVLSKNGSFDLGLTVTNPDHIVTMRYATLTIVTDVNQALGVAGSTYTYQLQAYTVPEPSTCLFLGLASILFCISRFYRKN